MLNVTGVELLTRIPTVLTDLNYIRDDGLHAIGYGGAQYAVYNISDSLALVGRGEVWRDNNGAFVAAFPGSKDFVNAEPERIGHLFSRLSDSN